MRSLIATQPETTAISRALGPSPDSDHEDGVDLGLHAILKIVVRLLIANDAPERAKPFGNRKSKLIPSPERISACDGAA
jgi:hypothetical protein